MKAKVCKFCKKKYKREAEEVNLFGTKFCLHDDKLDHYRKVRGMPLVNSGSSGSAEVVRSGRNAAEKNYIEKNERRGNVVVRAADGTLHAVGDASQRPSASPFRRASKRGR